MLLFYYNLTARTAALWILYQHTLSPMTKWLSSIWSIFETDTNSTVPLLLVVSSRNATFFPCPLYGEASTMPAIANWSRIVINLDSSSVLLHPIGLSPRHRLLFHNRRNDSWYFRHRSFMATVISVVFIVVFEVDIIVTASVWYSWYVAVLVGFYCIVIIFRSFIPRTSFMLLSHFRLLLSSIVVWWSSDDASAIGCSDMYLSVLALSGLR